MENLRLGGGQELATTSSQISSHTDGNPFVVVYRQRQNDRQSSIPCQFQLQPLPARGSDLLILGANDHVLFVRRSEDAVSS